MKFTFVRSVPIAVTVESNNVNDAWHVAGERVDDFMTDAVQTVQCTGHDDDASPYVVAYHGDAVYTWLLPEK